MNKVPIERLRAIFSYNPDSGLLTRRIANRKTPSGSPVGTKGVRGIFTVWVDGKQFKVHRIIWAISYGMWPTEEIDHINGKPWDNRLSNLREANREQQMHNTNKPITNKSGFKGVSFCRETRRWQAHIRIDGKSRRLGRFDTPKEASAAYGIAAYKAYGEFAKH